MTVNTLTVSIIFYIIPNKRNKRCTNYTSLKISNISKLNIKLIQTGRKVERYIGFSISSIFCSSNLTKLKIKCNALKDMEHWYDMQLLITN